MRSGCSFVFVLADYSTQSQDHFPAPPICSADFKEGTRLFSRACQLHRSVFTHAVTVRATFDIQLHKSIHQYSALTIGLGPGPQSVQCQPQNQLEPRKGHQNPTQCHNRSHTGRATQTVQLSRWEGQRTPALAGPPQHLRVHSIA